MKTPPSATHEHQSSDGSHIKLTWFENGAHAVVHILRKKAGVTFRISREEATALRAFLPADAPDPV